jgi:hypothetical protein
VETGVGEPEGAGATAGARPGGAVAGAVADGAEAMVASEGREERGNGGADDDDDDDDDERRSGGCSQGRGTLTNRRPLPAGRPAPAPDRRPLRAVRCGTRGRRVAARED